MACASLEGERCLTHDGVFIPDSNKGGGRFLGGFVRRAVGALLVSPFVSQRLRPFAATSEREDLEAMGELIERGEVAPVIDRTFALSETADAFRHHGRGHTRGKVVVTVDAST